MQVMVAVQNGDKVQIEYVEGKDLHIQYRDGILRVWDKSEPETDVAMFGTWLWAKKVPDK